MGLLDDAIREHLELKRRRGADAGEIAQQEQEALGPARRGPTPLQVPAPEEGADGHGGPADDDQMMGPDGVEAAESEHYAPEPEAFAEPYTEPAAAAEDHLPLEAALPGEEEDSLAGAAPPARDQAGPIDTTTRAFSSFEEADAAGAEEAQEGEVHPPDEAAYQPEEPLTAAEEVGPAPEEFAPYPEEPAPYPEEPAPHTEEPTPAEEAEPRSDQAPAHPSEAEQQAEGEDVLEETPEFLQETPDHDRLWFEQRPPRDFDFDK
jgi:hypothetical protein